MTRYRTIVADPPWPIQDFPEWAGGKGSVLCPYPTLTRAPGRWFEWARGRHSQKPDAFQDLVEQVSPGPYLELFARRQRLGWDTWGNEALNHVEMGAA